MKFSPTRIEVSTSSKLVFADQSEWKTMKTPRIKPSRSTRLVLKPERTGRNSVGPAVPAGRTEPCPTVSPPRTVGPLPSSRWSINEPHSWLPDVTSANSKTARPTNAPAPLRVVRFELFAPDARAAFLAGSFNDWNPTATPMIPCGEVRWVKELSLSPGGYEYLFVVDGRWTVDPKEQDYVPNPFGGCNSVLGVPS